jgi:hypothetical protein
MAFVRVNRASAADIAANFIFAIEMRQTGWETRNVLLE